MMLLLAGEFGTAWHFSGAAGAIRTAASSLTAKRPTTWVPSLMSQRVETDGSDFLQQVNLMEYGSNDVLPCFTSMDLDFGNDTFASLAPVEAVVTFGFVYKNEEIRLLDEEQYTRELFDDCKKACEEQGIEFFETPILLTARGPGLEDSDFVVEEDEPDTDHIGLVLEFEHQGRGYLLLRNLDPTYVMSKKLNDTTYIAATDEEISRVGPMLEQLVQEVEVGGVAQELRDGDDIEEGNSTGWKTSPIAEDLAADAILEDVEIPELPPTSDDLKEGGRKDADKVDA